jgi:plastocyanin
MAPMKFPLRSRSTALVAAAAVGAAALLGGCGGDDEPSVSADVPTSPSLDLVGTEMAYAPSEAAVAAGTVPVTLRNEGSVLHDVRIEDRWEFILEADPGETDTGEITLEPGTYVYFCSITGHREAGMEGVLEVRS